LLQEKLPLTVKGLTTIFSATDEYIINKGNIKDCFLKYMESSTLLQNPNSSPKTQNLLGDEIKQIQILSKTMDNKNTIISSSAFTLINSWGELVSSLIYYDSLTIEIFNQIFNIYDYYILASVNMFMQNIDKKNLTLLFDEINPEEIRKKGKIDSIYDTVLHQKKFSHLRKFLLRTKKNLEILFEVYEIDFLKQSYDNQNYEINEFHLPKLNTQIIINDSNAYVCMSEVIILFESIHSIYKYLKRLRHFSKKIQLDFQRKIVEDTIDNYKNVLNELKVFLYKPICNNIFKIDPILNKVTNTKWEPKESDSMSELSTASPFIDNLFDEISEKYEKLNIISGGSLTENAQKRFLDVMVIFVIEKLTETFSKIKKCNSFGRSIMMKDLKFLKSKLEEKFKRE
jgi:hypothetical protein